MFERDVQELEREGILFTTLEKLVAWGRSNSLWPVTFGLACCAIEMMASSNARNDLSRFGSEVFRASPRQAVAGRLSKKMAPILRRVYDQMGDPKWVIAMGACAASGGMFNNYAIVQSVESVVPVDVYVPGCPPRPEALIYAVMQLAERGWTVEEARGIVWIDVPADELPGFFEAMQEAGFNYLANVIGIDYSTYPEARPERFAVLYELVSIKGWKDGEVFDLLGIKFEGHPDLRKILTPEDLEGHPLRKDYPLGETPTLFRDGRYIDPAQFRASLTGQDVGLTGRIGGARRGYAEFYEDVKRAAAADGEDV